MPRLTRIEYEDVYYHVINRGSGRQPIFHSDVIAKPLWRPYQRLKSDFN